MRIKVGSNQDNPTPNEDVRIGFLLFIFSIGSWFGWDLVFFIVKYIALEWLP